jgi:hypothetical protein
MKQPLFSFVNFIVVFLLISSVTMCPVVASEQVSPTKGEMKDSIIAWTKEKGIAIHKISSTIEPSHKKRLRALDLYWGTNFTVTQGGAYEISVPSAALEQLEAALTEDYYNATPKERELTYSQREQRMNEVVQWTEVLNRNVQKDEGMVKAKIQLTIATFTNDERGGTRNVLIVQPCNQNGEVVGKPLLVVSSPKYNTSTMTWKQYFQHCKKSITSVFTSTVMGHTLIFFLLTIALIVLVSAFTLGTFWTMSCLIVGQTIISGIDSAIQNIPPDPFDLP